MAKLKMIDSNAIIKALRERDKRKKKVKRFELVEDHVENGMLCHSCDNIFGISTKFMDMVGETNFVYTCPYCNHKAQLDY